MKIGVCAFHVYDIAISGGDTLQNVVTVFNNSAKDKIAFNSQYPVSPGLEHIAGPYLGKLSEPPGKIIARQLQRQTAMNEMCEYGRITDAFLSKQAGCCQ
ncbi:hypothetical protein DSECCO2_454490 [anaerobic digester metagenome]